MKLKLSARIFIGIIAGGLIGAALPQNELLLTLLTPIGDIFIRLLRMIIVPLVTASMVMGMVRLGNIKHIGKLGTRTIFIFVITSILAASVGLLVTTLVAPGIGSNLAESAPAIFTPTEAPSIVSIIVGIVPKNLISAFEDNNMLSIIFFSIVFGSVLTTFADKARPIISVFDNINEAMMRLTQWIMKLAPFGVFSLMATITSKLGLHAFKPLMLYMITVILGLVIHSAVILPILLTFFARYSPAKLLSRMFTALATAFSTASSAATLPISMECLIKKVGVSNRVTGFTMPLGTTINMDGTALYQAAATLFIAQIYGISLTFTQLVIIVFTSLLASVGAAAIPSAGLVTMAVILKSVNVPIEGIGLILGVDRLIDMCRTAVNVWGNAVATVLISKTELERLSD